MLSKALRRLGLTVHIANHGREALKFLQKTRHWANCSSSDSSSNDGISNGNSDSNSSSSNSSANGDADELPHATQLKVILMDSEMPVMDGLTCTREIRRLEQTGELLHHLPIIAITANARAEQVQAAFTAGVVSLLDSMCY